MGFFAQLIASCAGGAIGGGFVLVGVAAQSQRQSKAALRAIMVEVMANKEAAIQMNRERSPGGEFVKGKPDPGWLKHSIWDSQLAYAVQRFDAPTLTMIRFAYSLLESVPAMVSERRAPGDPLYSHGGWIDEQLKEIEAAFADADKALDTSWAKMTLQADEVWYVRFASGVCDWFDFQIVRK